MSQVIDPVNGEELFQESWLKIRTKEINGKDFSNVKDYKNYFFRVLRNMFNDNKRKPRIKSVPINDKILRIEDEINEDEFCRADLVEWLFEEVEDDNGKHYRNMLLLSMQITNKAIQVNSLMSHPTYYEHKKEALKLARYEITNRIANTNNGQHDTLV